MTNKLGYFAWKQIIFGGAVLKVFGSGFWLGEG